jgi:hypothetical protein
MLNSNKTTDLSCPNLCKTLRASRIGSKVRLDKIGNAVLRRRKNTCVKRGPVTNALLTFDERHRTKRTQRHRMLMDCTQVNRLANGETGRAAPWPFICSGKSRVNLPEILEKKKVNL